MKPIYVNLGCGSRFHPEWRNFDLHSTSPNVSACNLLDGIPLPDESCDAVFNSALLEHLAAPSARNFLAECRRILKPGGILRIGVPDLEQIARIYLEKLEKCLSGDTGAESDYDWIMLEFLDQMVRTRSGGAMADFVVRGPGNEAFIEQRIGDEYRTMKASLGRSGAIGARIRQLGGMRPEVRRHKIRQRALRIPGDLRRAIASLFLSRTDRSALKHARFRMSGETHLWMYDRFSLPRLLAESGFIDAGAKPAGESAIPGWREYGLDLGKDGRPLKPDLLFVECRK
jgi:hypothetical protein